MPELESVWVHPEALPFDTQVAQFPASARDDLLDGWDSALVMAAERGSGAILGMLCGGAMDDTLDLTQAHAQWTEATGGYTGGRYGA